MAIWKQKQPRANASHILEQEAQDPNRPTTLVKIMKSWKSKFYRYLFY